MRTPELDYLDINWALQPIVSVLISKSKKGEHAEIHRRQGCVKMEVASWSSAIINQGLQQLIKVRTEV